MRSADRRRAWRRLGATIAHVPVSVFDDESFIVVAPTTSGVVRVRVGGETLWFYRRVEIVRQGPSTDVLGNAGRQGYRTRHGCTRDTLTEVAMSIDERLASRQ